MPWKIYKFTCDVCGVYTERKMSSGKTRRCSECGLEAAARAAYNMATRQGPEWNNFTNALAVSRCKRTDPSRQE